MSEALPMYVKLSMAENDSCSTASSEDSDVIKFSLREFGAFLEPPPGLDLSDACRGDFARVTSPARAPLGQASSEDKRTPLRSRAAVFVPASARVTSELMGCLARSMQTEPNTMMMRNIPIPYTRDDLIDLLDSHGFSGLYDFVYVPMDFKSAHNFGYAFVNFESPKQARRFQEVFYLFKDWSTKSQKKCVVCPAQIQGLHANVQYYRNNSVMSNTVPDSYKPALFSGGVCIPFPAPTRKLRPFGPSAKSLGRHTECLSSRA